MKQRGRKTAADLRVLQFERPRLKPPAELTPSQTKVFAEAVNSRDADFFNAGDLPLLIAYARAVELERWAAGLVAEDPSQLAEWERACRVMISLATKLRLTPQSRIDAAKAGRMSHPPAGKPPWE